LRRETVLAAIPPGPGRVAVEGTGVEAEAARQALGELVHGADPPRAIVVASGGVDAIETALQRVADGGAVIVVGPTPDQAPLDLYGDLHMRGLRLVVLE
jgi:threonine dehydrogenase-like Zn-dependent dehydrogenase